MDIINWELISQLTAGALVVVALIIVSNIIKAQNIAMAAVSDSSNKAVTATFSSAIQTLKEAQEGQRLFYQTKVDDLFRELVTERKERKDEVERLQKRISDLECEVEEKDKRIETLEDVVEAKDKRIETLEEESTKLKSEVERLKGQLNGKADKPRKGGR